MGLDRDNVSAYWFWLAAIAGLLSVLPTECRSVSFAYADGALCGYNDPYPTMNTAGWILLHAAVSVGLAVIATSLPRALKKRRNPRYQPDDRAFSLANLLLAVAAVVCVFSLLACVGAIPATYVAVLIFVGGRFAVVLLDALGL
jgi:hypothetical protein